MPYRALLALIATLLALAPSAALACGLPLGAQITFEQALLIVDGPRQQMITSVRLSEAAPDAAVLFPVPGTPQVDQPTGGAALFDYLAEATKPTVRVERRPRWGFPPDEGATGGAPAGVSLLGEQLLGGYQVARIAADDAGALQSWLDTNGYSVPEAVRPILAAYVAEGWSFVAVKLADAAPDGALDPLRISYESAELRYPMRLGALSDRPVGVSLFVLAANRVASERMETAFAGPTATLDPAPTAEIAALLGPAPYLTHLRARELAPESLTEDFELARAPTDEPFREERVEVEEVYLLSEAPGIFFALSCLVAITPLSLLAALAIRRRMDAIAPDPDKR